MNCEQVEERLSAYLDNVLVRAEWREVTVHLQTCSCCLALLTELRQNDVLLAQLPRVVPAPVLRERLFALSEMRELDEAGDYTARWCGTSQPFSASSYQALDGYEEQHTHSLLSSLVAGREQTPLSNLIAREPSA